MFETPKRLAVPGINCISPRAPLYDMANPNAPKQIKPGEDVRVVDNRISVSGQVAVMAINALLTKIIFDKNPTNEFYVVTQR